MGGRSYSPSPPPRGGGGHGRRGRSPSPRGRYGGGGGGGSRRGRDADLPTSLLVRNLRHDCRPEDLKRPFGQFGPLKDIYLPRDYYSGEPRGFGFVQFLEPADAAEAKYQMDGQTFQGRQLTVVFAEENRKKPTDMRFRERRGGGRFNDRRRSPPPRYSRSPPPRYARSRSHSREYSPPPKRNKHARSISPRDKRRSYSQSPVRERSPPYDGPARSRSRSPVADRSPPYDGSGSRSPSRSPPPRDRSPVRERRAPREPSRSRSPDERDYPRGGGADRDRSVSP
ncbi:serine/arginine-rich SC35-like splicing factor SCL30A [Rutidosis leptorrhynchoides]|uniref:serine/arginine-rich SC35-like splicing factor SCL30A n=1 Tax=Rutidosis leptorrhynchoides TaxID=125765 RepID=UPI003A9A4168